jgi:hypothetical protein
LAWQEWLEMEEAGFELIGMLGIKEVGFGLTGIA